MRFVILLKEDSVQKCVLLIFHVSSFHHLHLDNYINESVGLLLSQFCSEHHIEVIFGGYPNFSLAVTIPPSQPPVLLYRVVTCMERTSNHIHYSDFCSMGQWCGDGGKPIVGIQLFYYGVGMISAKITSSNGIVVTGNGDCGNLIITDDYSPVALIDYGTKDTMLSVVGFSNQVDGFVVEVKINLVANSFSVC